MRGALVVCGTTSDAGKTWFVTGLCRHLARLGVPNAPFKAQNMAPNAAITADGAEIGHAQWVQALAARVRPEAAMNPVLLRPLGNHRSSITVLGRDRGIRTVAEHHASIGDLRPIVHDALDDLRHRHDVVVCEGAGGAAEINLLDRDLSNLPLAAEAGIPAILVADIDRGGVFASLHGTIDLLPDHLRRTIRGFVINRLRGDAGLLAPGIAELEARHGIPCLGVLPMVDGTDLDAEDTLGVTLAPLPPTGSTGGGATPADGTRLDIAVVAHRHPAETGELDPLRIEPSVSLRLVRHPGELGHPHLVIVPSSSRPATDLAHHRRSGLADALAESDTAVLGLGTGLDLLSRTLVPSDGDDPDPLAEPADGVDTAGTASDTTADLRGDLPDDGPEASVDATGVGAARGDIRSGDAVTARPGLALLDLTTEPIRERRPHLVTGRAVHGPGSGNTIDASDRGARHVRPSHDGGVKAWMTDEHGMPIAWWDGDQVLATPLRGVLENDDLRHELLAWVADRAGLDRPAAGPSWADAREARIDRIADALETHLDLDALHRIIGEASPVVRPEPAGRPEPGATTP